MFHWRIVAFIIFFFTVYTSFGKKHSQDNVFYYMNYNYIIILSVSNQRAPDSATEYKNKRGRSHNSDFDSCIFEKEKKLNVNSEFRKIYILKKKLVIVTFISLF